MKLALILGVRVAVDGDDADSWAGCVGDDYGLRPRSAERGHTAAAEQ